MQTTTEKSLKQIWNQSQKVQKGLALQKFSTTPGPFVYVKVKMWPVALPPPARARWALNAYDQNLQQKAPSIF